MRLTDKQGKVLDALQWAMIAVLAVLCVSIHIGQKYGGEGREVAKETTYMKIYESQKISELKKKNKALYDSVTKLSSMKPESAVEIRYRYKHTTDTIKVTEFVESPDSVYHYTGGNDTVKTEVDVKAVDLEWCKVSTTIDDKFTIVNRSDGKLNETEIGHSANVEITGVDTWHRKKKLKE
ncbi:MAG: hypothetical protein J6Y37_16585, partial [Paludibacteraceae bacterium]|nr:hypothetical protein [Paludibacteraceae bacterium]